jgi:hypothetical protein
MSTEDNKALVRRCWEELCWLLGPSVQKSGVCGNMISLSSHTGECLPILFSQVIYKEQKTC